MNSKETAPTILYMNSPLYDTYLLERGIYPAAYGKAHGISYNDGHQEIVIDKEYYMNQGIDEKFIEAIIEHEQIELSDHTQDAHYHALIAEYTFIDTTYGRESLINYHNTVQQLYHESDTLRTDAFHQILGINNTRT